MAGLFVDRCAARGQRNAESAGATGLEVIDTSAQVCIALGHINFLVNLQALLLHAWKISLGYLNLTSFNSPVEWLALKVINDEHDFNRTVKDAIGTAIQFDILHRSREIEAIANERRLQISVTPGAGCIRSRLRVQGFDQYFEENLTIVRQVAAHERQQEIRARSFCCGQKSA